MGEGDVVNDGAYTGKMISFLRSPDRTNLELAKEEEVDLLGMWFQRLGERS